MKDSSAIFFVVALILISIGIVMIVTETRKNDRCTEYTVAEVTKWVEEKERNPNENSLEEYIYTYYPVIKYKAEDEEIVIQASRGYGSELENLKEMTIYYNPNNPKEYVYDREIGFFTFFFPTILFLFAAFLIYGGIRFWNSSEPLDAHRVK